MNCLYTVNIGDPKRGVQFITPLVKRAMVAACRRWGCQFAEILHPYQGKFNLYAKYEAARHLAGFDKLLFLDGDILIDDQAPNPFELCQSASTLYAVSDYQECSQNEGWRTLVFKSIPDFLTSFKPEHYFNTGFLMFAPSKPILELFAAQLNTIPADCRGDAWDIREQSLFNLLAYTTPNISIHLLPQTWNHMVPLSHMTHFGGDSHQLLNQL